MWEGGKKGGWAEKKKSERGERKMKKKKGVKITVLNLANQSS